MALRPDPTRAETVADYTQALRSLKAWAGDPSFERLGKLAELPGSTIFDALSPRRRRLPRLEVALKFVRACGVDETELARWEATWRKVSRTEATNRPVLQQLGVRRELPNGVAQFTAREDAMRSLDELRRSTDTANVAVICGTAGVGKTQLAIQWANSAVEHFPDGQLYLDLHGYSRGEPIDSTTALGMMIRKLLPGVELPPTEDERAATYRSLVAGRRLLVVLDNVATADQVRALLPTSPTSMALITSRDTLPGLVAREGAFRVALEALSLDAAVGLLRTLIGQRARFERTAAVELARRSDCLPLALRLVAELAASRPEHSLADLVSELAPTRVLDGLDAGGDSEASIREVMSWSRARLTAEAAEAFDLLGLVPGRRFDLSTMAAVAAHPEQRSRVLVDELVRSHLVATGPGGSYYMHDLLRTFAQERSDALPAAVRRNGIDRVLWHFAANAKAGHESLFPYYATGVLADEIPDGLAFADDADADEWFDRELPNLVDAANFAAAEGLLAHAHVLSACAGRYLDARGYFAEASAIHAAALVAARDGGDQTREAHALNLLGRTTSQRGLPAEAVSILKDAIALASHFTDTYILQAATANLGVAMFRLGRPDEAASYADMALSLAVDSGNLAAQSTALAGLADAYLQLGSFQQARDYLRQAADTYEAAGWHGGVAVAMEALAALDLQLEEPAQAVEHFERGLVFARIHCGESMQVRMMSGLATARRLCGDLAGAEAAGLEAVALARSMESVVHHSDVLQGLGDIAAEKGDLAIAQRRWSEAIRLISQVDPAAAHDLQVRVHELSLVTAVPTEDGTPSNVVLLHQVGTPDVSRGRCPDSAYRGTAP